jgi:hypothetical protein
MNTDVLFKPPSQSIHRRIRRPDLLRFVSKRRMKTFFRAPAERPHKADPGLGGYNPAEPSNLFHVHLCCHLNLLTTSLPPTAIIDILWPSPLRGQESAIRT